MILFHDYLLSTPTYYNRKLNVAVYILCFGTVSVIPLQNMTLFSEMSLTNDRFYYHDSEMTHSLSNELILNHKSIELALYLDWHEPF